MKHHTAPGASGISIDMLLLLPKEGWQTIALIFKTIIRTGIYPDIFKVGIITLLAKSQTSHGTLSNIRPITVLESTYRLFTNMISKRVTTLFYKYDIVPKEQHACLLGRGSAIPIMQMNAAMEHAIDQHKIPEELEKMEYKAKQMEAWQDVTIKTVHKNGNYTIQIQSTSKQKRKVKRSELRYKNEAKNYIHLLLTDLAACYDCIPFTIIQLCVTRMGLPPQFLRLIRGMQEQQHRLLKVNGQPLTPLFLLTGGLAQGCGLSCILLVCITSAIIAYTQSRKHEGTQNCHCHSPMLNQEPMGKEDGPPPLRLHENVNVRLTQS